MSGRRRKNFDGGGCICFVALIALAGPAFSSPNGVSNARAPQETKAVSQDNVKLPFKEEGVKHYNKAVALHQDGYLNQALAEYSLALAAEPRLREALFNQAAIFEAQKLHEKAFDCYIEALKISPHDSFATHTLCRIANAYDDREQSGKAEILYKELLSYPLPPAGDERIYYRQALVHYAQLLGRKGKRGEAKIVNARVATIRNDE